MNHTTPTIQRQAIEGNGGFDTPPRSTEQVQLLVKWWGDFRKEHPECNDISVSAYSVLHWLAMRATTTPPPQVTGVEEAADAALALVKYLNDHSHYIAGSDGVSFVRNWFRENWQASQPTPPLPKLSAEEVYARKNNSWLNQHNSYEKKLIIQLMQEYATTSPDNKLTDALELLGKANELIEVGEFNLEHSLWAKYDEKLAAYNSKYPKQ